VLYGAAVGVPHCPTLSSGGLAPSARFNFNPKDITMHKFTTLATGLTLAIASIGALAAPSTPRVDQREANQQARIDAGVASGQLNARETNRLDKQQARVAAAETAAKADGTVTPRERRALHRMQNRASKNIYSQKHDAQVAPKP
jgi:hypothetical protein